MLNLLSDVEIQSVFPNELLYNRVNIQYAVSNVSLFYKCDQAMYDMDQYSFVTFIFNEIKDIDTVEIIC